MQIKGRRITIAGSAANDTKSELLEYAHRLIQHLVERLISEGALIAVGVGREPHLRDDVKLPAIVFDWTVLESTARALRAGKCKAASLQGEVVATVATNKTTSQIPSDRRGLWDELVDSGALMIRNVEPGWTSGAIRRQMHAEQGDILICISGGEGVEHLAREFVLQGKPVIPLDLKLGAATSDGTGGAPRILGELKVHPHKFLRLANPGALGALLLRIETGQGVAPVERVCVAIIELINALLPPTAFYVRLLNDKVDAFKDVEEYFRNVVDSVVREFGYEAFEMGKSTPNSPWMNMEIFERIYYAGIVVVDLTGVRPNCLMELGYAFGRGRRVIVTAREGTDIPFDPNAIETRLWNLGKGVLANISELKQYWTRNINRPPLVAAKGVL